MPFIEVDFTQDYEDTPAAEGVYDLRIASAKDKKSKAGNDMTEVMVVFEGEEGHPPIFEYLVYPNKKTEPKTARLFMQKITRFCKAFEVPMDETGFNSEDLPGLVGTDIPVGLEDGDNGPRNVLKLPRV